MFIILLSSICCIIAVWCYIKITSQINVLVPKLPKAINFYEFGLFRFSFNDLYKRIFYIGEYTNENGGVTRFNYGPVTAYVVSDAEDMVTVLNKCTKKIFLYDLIKPYVGSQLVAADLPVWKRNRRLLDLAFKQNILNGYIDIFNDQAKRLTIAMGKEVNKEVDFSSMIGQNFLETTCLTTLGIQMNGQETIINRYIKSVDRVIDIMTSRFRQPWLFLDIIFKFSSLKKEQDEALKIVWDFSEQIIKRKKIELSQKTKKNNDSDEDKPFQSILETVMENRDENELSDFHLRQLMDNVMLAAFDTNIPGLLFTLLCIGGYPEVQKKVYEEVITVTGRTDKDILKEDLPKLVYLEAVIKEAIRLYPPGMVIARTATSEVQLKDYILPNGCQVVVHLGAVNRNKKYWGQDADGFRPERWFDSLPDQNAFATFSPGRRGCVGRNYALMQLKITVAKIIKKFHINGNDKNLDLEFVIFLKATAGHLIKLELRDQEIETKP